MTTSSTKYLLMPTRLRGDLARKGIASWRDLAHAPDRVVPILGVDSDDPTDYVSIAQHVVTRSRLGYRRIDVYYNDLAAYARKLDVGADSWLLISNDDQVGTTADWDLKLDDRGTSCGKVLFLKGDMGLPTAYPVVTSRLFDVWGHLALNTHVDTWLALVAAEADQLLGSDLACQEFASDIQLVHRRLEDCVTREAQWDIAGLHSPETIQLRRRDSVLLALEHGYQGGTDLATVRECREQRRRS